MCVCHFIIRKSISQKRSIVGKFFHLEKGFENICKSITLAGLTSEKRNGDRPNSEKGQNPSWTGTLTQVNPRCLGMASGEGPWAQPPGPPSSTIVCVVRVPPLPFDSGEKDPCSCNSSNPPGKCWSRWIDLGRMMSPTSYAPKPVDVFPYLAKGTADMTK